MATPQRGSTPLSLRRRVALLDRVIPATHRFLTSFDYGLYLMSNIRTYPVFTSTFYLFLTAAGCQSFLMGLRE
jgi:hypothetical protein